MSVVRLSSLRLEDHPRTAVKTYWCLVCQLTLRSEEECLAHIKVLPTHRVKAAQRVFCRACGNDMSLEDGRFPDHWVGGGLDIRRCHGSRTAP